MMVNDIFQEENHFYKFDFTSAIWATDRLHNIFQQNKATILSDVDFIAETESEIILLEYKNANIPNAAHPERFVPSDPKSLQKIAYKYYDSWIYLMAINKSKLLYYVYICEHPSGDSTTRRVIRNKIADLLPFELQKLPEMSRMIIKGFEVLSVDEWNAHEKYRSFPITQVSNQ